MRTIRVKFDQPASKALLTLKLATGASSIAEVIRKALGLYEWAVEKHRLGYIICAAKPGEPLKQVLLFTQDAPSEDAEVDDAPVA